METAMSAPVQRPNHALDFTSSQQWWWPVATHTTETLFPQRRSRRIRMEQRSLLPSHFHVTFPFKERCVCVVTELHVHGCSWIQVSGRFSGVLQCKSVDYPSNSGSGRLPFDFCVIWRTRSCTKRHSIWKFCCSRSARSQMSVLETRVLMRSSERCDQAQGTETRW